MFGFLVFCVSVCVCWCVCVCVFVCVCVCCQYSIVADKVIRVISNIRVIRAIRVKIVAHIKENNVPMFCA